MTIYHGGAHYRLVTDVRDNPAARRAFWNLARTVFGIDFERWYRMGGWTGTYQPYLLMQGDRAVANLSVTPFRSVVAGDCRQNLQIGTVMTDPAYRLRGLAGWLMRHLLEVWRDTCDLIFLFANDRAVGFYPPFGFVPAEETESYCPLPAAGPKTKARPVSAEDPRVRTHFIEAVKHAAVRAEMSAGGQADIVLFHALEDLRENLYYLPEWDAYLMASVEGDRVRLIDLFCERELPFAWAARSVAPDANELVLGFTPIDRTGFLQRKVHREDDHLFLYGRDRSMFEKRGLMVPLTCHT